MKRLIYISCILFVVVFTPFLSAQEQETSKLIQKLEISKILDDGVKAWEIGADSFMQTYGRLGFRWVSSEKKTARTYGTPLFFLDIPIVESFFRFENNKLNEIDLLVYNRGDLGVAPEAAFQEMIKEAEARTTKWEKSRPKKIDNAKTSSWIHKEALVWNKKPHQVALEYSYSTGSKTQGQKFLPEYIRIRCIKYDLKTDMSSTVVKKMAASSGIGLTMRLKKSVQKEKNGDVFINGLPMVDQGQKGYCSVATAERVLRYYGKEVSQHDLAQLAQTFIGGGTSQDTMLNALKKASFSMGCKVQTHYESNVKHFIKLIEKYNKAAKKEKKTEIKYGRMIMVSEIFDKMDTDILKSVKKSQTTDYTKFIATIKKYIDKGIPLCWGVTLGKIEEPELKGLQSSGGHMRLIIGYNKTTSQLVFSDSWGQRHEKKYMDMLDAWTITTGLFTIEPK